MTFQFSNPAPVLWELNALAPAAGGSLQFFNIGTTTPRTTWADFARTTPNLNPVGLDSAGRPNVPLWLDGDYSVVLRDSDGVTVDTFDLRDPATGGAVIPSLVSGRFLTNNGTALQWTTIRQVPDPTGNANRILGTDGSNLLWEAKPTAPVLPITVRANGISIGDGTNTYRILEGSATGVNAGGATQTVTVTFPITFTAAPKVFVTNTNAAQVAPSGNQPSARITSISTTGFTVVWTLGDISENGVFWDYNAAVTFDYMAIGRAST